MNSGTPCSRSSGGERGPPTSSAITSRGSEGGWEKKPITVAEANAFYGEEKAAWEHGSGLLDERGFTRWFRFGQVCEKSLATYERAIQSCCAGWRGPPLNDFLDPLVARDPPSVA